MGVFEDLLNWLKSIFGESGEIITEIHEWMTNFPEKLFEGFRYIVDQLVYVSLNFFTWISDGIIWIMEDWSAVLESNGLVIFVPIVAVTVIGVGFFFIWRISNYAYEKIPVIG